MQAQPITTQPATRAAIYVRVSSTQQEQDGTSLDTQLECCHAYAAAHGYDVTDEHVYREVHTGVELWQRPKLTALREAVRRRDVDLVIAYAIDRLSRDPVHMGVIISEAEHAGVDVQFVSEPLDNSPEGQLIRFVRGYAAKVEHAKFVERSQRGKLARAHAGKLMHGKFPLYGYAWSDETRGAYVPDPVTAPVVRRIFADALAGKPTRRIAGDLTFGGITPPRGGPRWDSATITRMLRNVAYSGEAYAMRTMWIKAANKNGHHEIARPREEWIKLPDGTIPPLVDAETLAAIGERLELNKLRSSRRTRNPEDYLLRAGFVRCGYCGYAMGVVQKTTAKKCVQSPAYSCVKRSKLGPGSCGNVGVVTHWLDARVWADLAARIANRDFLAGEIARLREADPTEADLAAVATAAAEVERRQANTSRAIAALDGDGDAAAPLIAELKRLAEQKRGMESERAALLMQRAGWEAAQANLNQIEAWCEGMAGVFGEDLTYEDKRRVLDVFRVQVRVFRADHAPRYRVRAVLGLSGEIEFGGDATPATAPSLVRHPRTSTRSGST